MAIVMIMRWENVTPEQYDQLREIVRWEIEAPEGGIYHVAAFDDSGVRITDVWESAEDFQRFTEQRPRSAG